MFWTIAAAMVRIEKNKHLSDQAATFIYSIQFTELKDVIPLANDSGPTQLLSKAVAYILQCGLVQLAREIALRYFYLFAIQQARLRLEQQYSILKYNTEHSYRLQNENPE